MADSVKATKLLVLQKNLVRFFKEVRNELKKVIWLNRQQLINNTVTVLLSCLIVGAIIWIADAGLLKLSEVIFFRR